MLRSLFVYSSNGRWSATRSYWGWREGNHPILDLIGAKTETKCLILRLASEWRRSTGNESGDLLAKLRVFQEERVFAALKLLLVLVMLVLEMFLKLALLLVAGLLVENTDGSVLTDPVGDFGGVNPHRELRGEETVEHGGQEANICARLGYHRVHFAVDSDTAVARSSIGSVGEPVIPVPSLENLCQRALEQLQLPFCHLACLNAQQIHQKICRWNDFQPHGEWSWGEQGEEFSCLWRNNAVFRHLQGSSSSPRLDWVTASTQELSKLSCSRQNGAATS